MVMKSIYSAIHLAHGQSHAAPSSTEWSADSPRVYLPDGFEKNYSYPVLVWLNDDSPAVFQQRMREISDRNYVGIQIPWSSSMNDLPEKQMPRIEAAVNAVSEYANLHSERVYLMGERSCGAAALQAVLASPLKFAGFLAVDPQVQHLSCSFNNFRTMKHLKGLLAVPGEKASPTVLGYAELLHAGGLQVRVQKYADNEPRSLPRLLDHFLMQQILGEQVKFNR